MCTNSNFVSVLLKKFLVCGDPVSVALERTAVAMTTVYIPPQDKVSAALSHPKSRLNTMKCTDADIQ